MCYSLELETNLKKIQQDLSASINIKELEYLKKHQLNNKKPLKITNKDQSRIYPGYYTYVLCLKESDFHLTPMRYGIFPPSFTTQNKKTNLIYNTRSESLLHKFWSESFGQQHGLIVAKGFYEWVNIVSYVNSNDIELEQVKQHLEKLKEKRRKFWLNKPYNNHFKLTPNEEKPLNKRKILVYFYPSNNEFLYIPTLFNKNCSNNLKGFSVLTKNTDIEINTIEHSRMPISLEKNQALKWLETSTINLQSCAEKISAISVKRKFQNIIPQDIH
ncbi:MAG: hypothetical protein CMP11_08905 [Zetaproteobacteria bacterium]|nr:hypothetical protein [Pseudobdellovibrionaceae bacterium]|tara:strand:- start:491 stop:1309 length:819 start_codon:yes stop_codon:yes gene_type:complete